MENKGRFDSSEPIQNDRFSVCPPVNPIKLGGFKAGRDQTLKANFFTQFEKLIETESN